MSRIGDAIIRGMEEAIEVSEIMAENERLREALTEIIDMTDNCADVPRNPDSLPMMVMEHARAALSVCEGKDND